MLERRARRLRSSLLGGTAEGRIGLAVGLFFSLLTLAIVFGAFSTAVMSAPEMRRVSLPRDYGKHPACRGEWWYVSGHLKSDCGETWAYHLALFRISPIYSLVRNLVLKLPIDTYWGHLVLTHKPSKTFVFRETLAAPWQASASEDRLEVRVNGWALEESGAGIMLSATAPNTDLSLQLLPRKPPVLHFDGGYLNLKPTLETMPVNAYLSLTSLATSGRVLWNGKSYQVTGASWFDRQFWSGETPESLNGWDWFALTLDNGYEFMLSVLRFDPQRFEHVKLGTIIRPDGTWRNVELEDFDINHLDTWRSEATNAIYPMGWAISIPSMDLKLTAEPVLRSHEILPSHTDINYWEGPVDITGFMGKEPVTGQGLVELTGYAQTIGGKP